MVCILCFLPHTIERSRAQTRERLIPFEQDDLWGYKSSSGQVVIKPQFHFAGNFSREGIAGVVDDNGPAYIDRKGNVVVRTVSYDNGPDPFEEGLAICIGNDDKVGFFDETGRVVIQPQFGSAFAFHEGLAAVCTGCRMERIGDARVVRGGEWGFINHTGKFVIKPQFDFAYPFDKGLAEVCMGCIQEPMGEHSMVTGGKWGSIDKHGKIVTPFRPRQE